MTQRLILHIGHPKTGTTALQKTLRASRPALIEAGILHPNTGRHHNHKVLLPYLIDEPSLVPQKGSSPSELVKDASNRWTNLLEEMRASKPDTMILSSESLFYGMKEEGLKKLSSHLKPLAAEITVAAYLREPASFALSKAQQNIKRHPNYSLPTEDYYRTALELYKNSGLGSMNVRIFDRKKLTGGDIVEDFFDQHLPSFDLNKLTRDEDVNTSFSAEAMALIQEVHRKERSFAGRKARHLIEVADRELSGFSRPRMHEHIRHAIQARATDLDWLKDEYGIEFSKIDASAMPRSEANQQCDALDRVDDMCIVDADRKEALWNAACKNSQPIRGLFRRILNKG